jgi:hypothetical protein
MTNLIDFGQSNNAAKTSLTTQRKTAGYAVVQLGELNVNSLHALATISANNQPLLFNAVLDELDTRATRLDDLAETLLIQVRTGKTAEQLYSVVTLHIKDVARAIAKIEALLARHDGSYVDLWFPASEYKSNDAVTAHQQIVKAICELEYDYQTILRAEHLQKRARSLRGLVSQFQTEAPQSSVDQAVCNTQM